MRDRGPDDLLFPNSRGGFLNGGNWKRDSHYSTKHAHGRQLHDLRHSFATNALTAGANVRVVSRILGHASIKETIDRYGRWIRDDAEDAALDRLATAWTTPGDARGARTDS